MIVVVAIRSEQQSNITSYPDAIEPSQLSGDNFLQPIKSAMVGKLKKQKPSFQFPISMATK